MSVSKKNIAAFDELEISTFHWRMVFTAGIGFFTDAYDLFVIGIVTAILAPIWHLTTSQLALLNGAALAAAAAGAIMFGIMSDKFGRKKLYGFEVLILFFGSILAALSTSFTWLLLSRILVGFGIGGDYPSSAVVVSEHSNRKNRGYLVLLVFAMQAVGLIVGPLLASLFLATNMPHNIVWRLLLGLGAIPAASVFYLRRKIEETPHYLLTKSSPFEVSRIVSDLTGHAVLDRPFKRQRLFERKWFICLLGTASAWFLLDVAFYGNGISSVLIIGALSPNADLLSHTVISAFIFLLCAVPGYFLAAKYIDRIGRKTLQFLGFAVLALVFAAMALIPNIEKMIGIFLILFGLSFFFVNFGPNTTTFLIPSEIYPTNIRAKAHGISAAVGKVGAFVGAFFLPPILAAKGLAFTMGIMSVVSILGFLSTFLIPEMTNVSLSETEVQH